MTTQSPKHNAFFSSSALVVLAMMGLLYFCINTERASERKRRYDWLAIPIAGWMLVSTIRERT